MQKLINRSAFFLLLFFSIPINSSAQDVYKSATNVDIKNGPDYKDDWATYLVKVIGQNASGIYALRCNYGIKHFFLEKYDPEMNKIFSTKIDTLHKSRDMPLYTPTEFLVQEAYLLKGKVYIFGSIYDYRKNINILYGGSYNSSGERYIEMTQICTISSDNKLNAGYFNISISEDSSKISITKVEKFSQLKKERFSLFIIDTQLKLLWTKDIELPYNDSQTSILQSLIDNEGNMHFLVKIWLEEKKIIIGEPEYFYTIFSYYQKEAFMKQHELSMGKTFISSLHLYFNDKNHLSGSGFYSEKTAFKMKGVFCFSIDPQTRKLTLTTQQNFSLLFIAQFISPSKSLEKALAKKDSVYLFQKATGLSNFAVRNVITKSDGGSTLIAEYFYDAGSTSYTSAHNSSGTNFTANFNDLIVIGINADGSVAWTKKIGKKQYAPTGLYLITYYNRKTAPVGITSFQDDNNTYILYNESPSNFKDTSDFSNVKQTMNNPGQSVTTLVTISKDGEIAKTPLFPEIDSKLFITPRFTQQISGKTLLLYGEKGQTYRFTKVHFN